MLGTLSRPQTDAVPGPEGESEAQAADLVSVIIPVLTEYPTAAETFAAYNEALAATARPVEFLYVLGPNAPRTLEELTRLKDAGEPLAIVVLSRVDSETAALDGGLRHARGETIMTLPAFAQVEPADLPEVLAALSDCDMVVAGRASRSKGTWQARLFHWSIRVLFRRAFDDLVCRARVCRRLVLEEIIGYSGQAHFLPLLASERGFRVREVTVREGSPDSSSTGVVGMALSRLRLTLDGLALFFVLKFFRRPLRFFGAFGLPILLVGLLYTGALGIGRLFFGIGLADRPALILGVLMIVLGIQVIALGLIGEIIIFASGKRIKDYAVEKVL